MQKFYFQAVTAEGKQISGYITAESEAGARGKLKASNLSVLTLEKRAVDVTKKQGVVVFEFEGTNTQKKLVKGTIEAADAYEAFKKLKSGYRFELNYLVMASLAESEKAAKKQEGIDPEWESKLEVERKVEAKLAQKNNKKRAASDEGELESVLKEHEEEIEFMRQRIDEVLSQVIPLLEENTDYIDPLQKREIEERLDLLSRLKHSNSVDHLRNLTKKILDQVSSDAMFLQDANLSPEMKAEIERRRQKFQSVNEKFDRVITKGLVDIQKAFEGVSVQGIKDTVVSFHAFERLKAALFFYFASLSVISFLFWGGIMAQSIMGLNGVSVDFYLSSPLLWYVTGFAVLWAGIFYWWKRQQTDNIKRALIPLGVGIVLWFIYTIQFPVLFFWTG